MADKTTLGFKALRKGVQESDAQRGEPSVARHTTGMPDRPKPGWWPDDAPPGAIAGEDANLHVGKGLRLKGEVSACDRLTVEGDVEATIAARELDIGASGQVKGKAEVETASIDGRFDGELTVSGCLTVRRSGRVSGTIVYDALEVEKGGCLTGELTRSEAAPETVPLIAPAGEPASSA